MIHDAPTEVVEPAQALPLAPHRSLPQALAAAALALALAWAATAAAPAPPASSGLPAALASASDTGGQSGSQFQLAGGGAKQVVRVGNTRDTVILGRGRMQLNEVPGPSVVPVNIAIAQSTCTDCQTLAVALQIDLYKRGSPFVAPQNAAAAVNAHCLRCLTVAVAIQYVIPADDPTNVPSDVRKLGIDLDKQLKAVATDSGTSIVDRLAALQAVVDRFTQFAAYLYESRQQVTASDATSADELAAPYPQDTSDPMATVAPTDTPFATPIDTPAPTDTPPPAPTDSPTVAPTDTSAPTDTPPSDTPTPIDTPTP